MRKPIVHRPNVHGPNGHGPNVRRLAALAAAACLTIAAACAPDDQTLTLPDDDITDQQPAEPDPEPEPEEPDDGDDEGEDDGQGETGDLDTEHGDVDAQTQAEIEQFIVDFLQEFDAAWATGDASSWSRLYTDACTTCADELDYIEHIHSDGGSVEGGEYLDPTPSVRGEVPDEEGVIEVRVETTVTAYEISGPAARSAAEEETIERFNVSNTADGWRVVWWY